MLVELSDRRSLGRVAPQGTENSRVDNTKRPCLYDKGV